MYEFIEKKENLNFSNTKDSPKNNGGEANDKFVPKYKTGTVQLFRDNTNNLKNRKVSFKHV